ncbi:MAG: TraB/GumN family protein [Desulfovibrionaceae bacterium]|nr:TraB/GumN family protein [Desulfovibrionaceae bacterium]
MHAHHTPAPDIPGLGGRAELFAHVLEHAQVPEHSPAFMSAMSGGNFFVRGDYCFLAAQDWLMALGYPLRNAYSPEAFEAALRTALAQTNAQDCWCIAPELPSRLAPHEVDADDFFVLPVSAAVPARLHRPLERARAVLRVDMTTRFSPQHRRLWSEFMARTPLKPNARELFARTEQVMGTPGLVLLNAWDEEERLAACLLLDFAPGRFVSYLIGAHSRGPYTPYASDLLMATLLDEARKHGKDYIHLGLGVNEGIRRFKRKWGAVPSLPYRMAAWKEQPDAQPDAKMGDLLAVLATAGAGGALSKRQTLSLETPQRPFAMLWEVEKNGKRSWIGGAAHFFCYSFENSFRRLFRQVDTILLEGPLDEESLNAVARSGRMPGPDVPRVGPLLTQDEIRVLERVARGPEGFWPRLLNMETKNPVDARYFLEHTHPWCALFSLWTAFLERQGWKHSVDLEIWRLGHDMGKTVIAMESLEEQIASLESVTVERVANFFRNARQWQRYIKRNTAAYLAGDLMAMMGTSTEFPTRTEIVINRRDQRFRERMRPFLEAGRCAVFVGTAHMLGLIPMLEEDGFRLTQVMPTWRHALCAKLRAKETP